MKKLENQINEKPKDITKNIENKLNLREWNDTGEKKNHPNLDLSIIGKKFRKLTVISFHHYDKIRELSFWNCECDCGNTNIVSRNGLNGRTISCGCESAKGHQGKEHARFKDLEGKKFGKLLVISLHSFNKKGGTKWNCICNCGKNKTIYACNLIHGKSKSCGCLAIKNRKKRAFDLTGEKFGSYTVIKKVKNAKTRHGKSIDCWKCECKCGIIKLLETNYLKDYANKGCKKCFGMSLRGKNHHNWNSDLTEKERNSRLTERNKPEYGVWKRLVFKRDNNTCQITGKKGKICAHHLECFHANKELRTTVDNGITLLQSVHDLFHHLYGTRNNTKKQFQEFTCNLTKEQLESFK